MPISLIKLKNTLFIVLILCISPFTRVIQLQAQVKQEVVQFQKSDQDIVEDVLSKLREDKKLETGTLVIKVGHLFLETPYVASTLEVGGKEKMVINLREMDCTTFAENCLALARTIKKDNPTFDNFVNELKYIRYRDGILNEYPSRLHYFSDWIHNNDKKKTVKDISVEFGNFAFKNKINFMSNHPEDYPALKSYPEYIKEIAVQENEVTNRKTWYLPKNKFSEYEHLLHDGDIIGITTSMPGMDISHVVIAILQDGRIHLLNASSKHKKVLVSHETLEQYLNTYKSITGIMVARPL